MTLSNFLTVFIFLVIIEKGSTAIALVKNTLAAILLIMPLFTHDGNLWEFQDIFPDYVKSECHL